MKKRRCESESVVVSVGVEVFPGDVGLTRRRGSAAGRRGRGTATSAPTASSVTAMEMAHSNLSCPLSP